MYYTKLSTVLLYLIMEIITCKLVSMSYYRILTGSVEGFMGYRLYMAVCKPAFVNNQYD
jgi:hypothetical protein